MLIWQGKGILVALPFVLFPTVLVILSEAMGVDSAAAVGTGLIVAGVTGAIGLWFLDRWLERRNPPRVMVDKQTGQEVRFKRRDTLFFVPMRFLPYVYAVLPVLGLLAIFTG